MSRCFVTPQNADPAATELGGTGLPAPSRIDLDRLVANEELPFPTGTFDAAICSEAREHVVDDEPIGRTSVRLAVRVRVPTARST